MRIPELKRRISISMMIIKNVRSIGLNIRLVVLFLIIYIHNIRYT